MRIIADLEDAPRGVYCGTVGYLAPPADPGPRARFNVAIRTAVQDAATGLTAYGVGGGITWDSSAGAEYDETVAKARVLTRAPPVVPARRDDDRPGRRAGPPPRPPPRAAAGLRRRTSGSPPTRRRSGRRSPSAARPGADAPAPARPRPARARGGRGRDGAGPPRHRAGRDRRRTAPVDPADVFLFHKTTAATGLRRGARPPRRGAGRRAHEPARRGDRVDDRERRGTRRRPVVHAAGRRGPACRASVARWRSTRDDSRSGPITVAELRAADEVALVSDNRGWRRATLV